MYLSLLVLVALVVTTFAAGWLVCRWRSRNKLYQAFYPALFGALRHNAIWHKKERVELFAHIDVSCLLMERYREILIQVDPKLWLCIVEADPKIRNLHSIYARHEVEKALARHKAKHSTAESDPVE